MTGSERKPRGQWEGFDSGYEDSIVCGEIKHNRDGSVTINCQIDVTGPTGESWQTFRKFRLGRLSKEESR